MKSYKNLFDDFVSNDNILLAIKNASKNKLDRTGVKQIHDHPEEYIEKFRNYATHFYNKEHKPCIIYDGTTRKKRIIIKPEFDEQVVHHMIINVLKPIFQKSMYYHSYGSLPGKGAHKGKKTIQKWIRNGKRGKIKYCLKMDIHHFFPSIPHDILIRKLRKIIRDDKFLKVIIEVINATEGLPLGFYTSQWLANWYLTGLDYAIKENFDIYYIRYMDDMVVFCSNKQTGKEIREFVQQYLEEELGLTLKDNWQKFRFDYIKSGKHRGRFLDFMGFKFYRDRTTIRRNIFLSAKRTAKRISKKKKVTIHDAKRMMSYMGWFKHTNTYGAYLEHIKPYINVQYLKRRISTYDKRMARSARESNTAGNLAA